MTVKTPNLRSQIWRGILGTAGIQALTVGVNVLLVVLLARNLGPSDYGVYAYALAIMSFLLVAGEAGVPTLIMREVATAEGRNDFGLMRGVMRRGIQFVLLVSVSVSIIGLVVLSLFADQNAQDVILTTSLMLFLLPLIALNKTIGHILRGLGRVVVALVLEPFLRSLLVTVFVGILLLTNPSLLTPYLAMAAQIAAALISLGIASFLAFKFLPTAVRTVSPLFQSRRWIKSSVPFVLIGGSLVINNQTDIIMLGWFTDLDEVGTYRIAVQGASLIMFPLLVFQQVIGPQFAKLYGSGKLDTLKSVDRKGRLLIFAGVSTTYIVIAVFSESILTLVFGPSFVAAQMPLIILGFGLLATASCGASGTLVQMIGGESFVSKLLLFTSLLNILGNFLLIPQYGSNGAAFTTGLTTFLYQFILRLKANTLLKV